MRWESDPVRWLGSTHPTTFFFKKKLPTTVFADAFISSTRIDIYLVSPPTERSPEGAWIEIYLDPVRRQWKRRRAASARTASSCPPTMSASTSPSSSTSSSSTSRKHNPPAVCRWFSPPSCYGCIEIVFVDKIVGLEFGSLWLKSVESTPNRNRSDLVVWMELPLSV